MAMQLEPKIARIILDVITPHSDEYKNNFQTYVKLDESNITEYLCSIDNTVTPNTQITEIGDGNLNQVFRIAQNSGSRIIKQALPYLRCVGESYALDKIRMKYEIAYLKIASDLCGRHVPKLYYADDTKMMLIYMQDLNNHQIMRDGLINGFKYPNFSRHIAEFLATILFKTSRNYLNLLEHSTLIKTFNDNKLRCLTEDLFFTFAFIDHDANYKNSPHLFSFKFRSNVKVLLDLFATNAEALLHGDLHTGSIFVNNTETYIIDGEFAFMGPSGFDLGLLLANLITAYIHHKICNLKIKSNSMQLWLIRTIEEVYENFNNMFKLLSIKYREKNKLLSTAELDKHQDEYLNNVLKTSIGFAGIEMCRRACGLAGVREIRNIPEPELKEQAENLVLSLGIFMVENYQEFTNITDLTLKLRS